MTMRWKGTTLHRIQPAAGLAARRNRARRGVSQQDADSLTASRHGQTMLAIELYAADKGIELREPTHSFDGRKRAPLTRSTADHRNHPPLWVASPTQFSDYLVMRGLRLVK
jgi:hypothetical protein